MQKSKWYKILAPCVFILLIVPVAACSQPSTTEDLEQPVQPAEFSVGPVTLAPSTAMVGDVVTVAATVTNTGDVSGTYTAALSIDGQEADKKDITIEPGGSQQVSFQLTKTTAGSYNLAIGSSSTTLTVYDWSPYTIQYFESQGALAAIYVSGENGHIVHFTPPAKAFRIQKIKIYGTVYILNTSEFDEKYITVRIWDKEGNNQLWSQDFPWRLFMGDAHWQEIKVPDIRVDDDFNVELVTNSNPMSIRDGIPVPGGDPIGIYTFGVSGIAGRGGVKRPDVWSVVVIGFDYPQSNTNAPLNRPETRSGYSLMGKLIDPGQDRLKGIRWLIRVEGEGAPGD